jgi:dTDP-4-dehydrorhamnose reductase
LKNKGVKMKVFITGGISGQLGYSVCRVLKQRGIDHICTSSKQLDITDKTAVFDMLSGYQPDAVIHCAAYTNVDEAEDEEKRCFEVNEGGTRNIAEACKKVGAKLTYISTDYVFPGVGVHYHETDDATGPLCVYGQSKLAGEIVVRQTILQHFIVRTSWVFGSNGNNFVKTMLNLAQRHDSLSVVSNQIGSPTYALDLAMLLCDMIETEKYGIYHATNEGICSWAEFAQEIFKQSGKSVTVIPISACDYGAKASRPPNSRLSKTSLDKGGFSRLPIWQDALKRYLAELAL